MVDVSNQPTEGALNITKKNLISLNPDINLSHHINAVDHIEYILKMSPTLTETVLVTILPPIGDPPENYDFLDIWPMTFTQTVTGPQDFVTRLKEEGLEIVFNLDEISKEELDSLPPEGLYDDIINFNVPASWKKIAIPLPGHHFEAINDPEAQNCYITFLRKKLLPIPIHLPVQVFYPLKNSTTINPSTYKLGVNQFIDLENEIPTLSTPLFANNVSQLFLEVVLDNLQLQIVAAPKSEREKLEWSICFVNQSHLEETYVAYLFNHARPRTRNNPAKSQERDTYLRHRFRNFLRHFTLYLSKQTKFELESTLKDSQVKVHVPNVTQAAATIEESY